MAEILLNSQSPVRYQIFWNGEITIPDASPSVKLYDITEDPAVSPPISPSYLLENLTAIVDENNPGSYIVYIPFQYTNRNRTLKLVWEYSISGKFASAEDEVFVVTPYVNFNHIQELGFSVDPSDPEYKSYKELLLAEKYARKQIENYTGQKFFLYDDVYSINGYNSDILPIPTKISSLHELYANDVLLLDNINSINNWGYNIEITTTGYGIRVNRSNILDNIVYVANGMVPPSVNDYSAIFRSDTTYRIQGRFGWDKVPDDVELAGIELMKDYFAKDRTWRNKYVKNISTFDWNFEYTSDAYMGTGNAYADRLLAEYVMVSKAEII